MASLELQGGIVPYSPTELASHKDLTKEQNDRWGAILQKSEAQRSPKDRKFLHYANKCKEHEQTASRTTGPPRSSSDAREVTLSTPTPLPHDTSPPYTNVNNVTSTSTSIPSRLRSVPEVSDPTNTAHTYNRHPSSTPELSSKTSNSDHVTWVQNTTAPTWVKTTTKHSAPYVPKQIKPTHQSTPSSPLPTHSPSPLASLLRHPATLMPSFLNAVSSYDLPSYNGDNIFATDDHDCDSLHNLPNPLHNITPRANITLLHVSHTPVRDTDFSNVPDPPLSDDSATLFNPTLHQPNHNPRR
jgi:hypothetical protein